MRDAITIGIPVLAILFGILLNQHGIERVQGDISNLRAEMNTKFAKTDGRIDRVQADLAQFYQMLGQHDAKIKGLERRKA